MNATNLTAKRIIALDFLRGLTIAAMIVVNNQGNYQVRYNFIAHANWDGITLADFVFPFFIFIMGVSITLSLSKLMTTASTGKLIWRISKRTLLLFALGLLVNLFLLSTIGGFRIAGVLQRIAIVYLICSILYINTNWKAQAIIAALVLVGYWVLMAFVPVPGLGRPSLEPVNNLASWFDRHYLPGMLFEHNHDPEGILSTFPAIVTGILGLLTGAIIKRSSEIKASLGTLFLLGFILSVAGLAWSLVFPLNKNLWSSSFVLLTGGSATILLAVCIWVIDIKSWKGWSFPFVVFGSNAIAAYLISFLFLIIVWPPIFGPGKGIIQASWDALVSIGVPPKLSSVIWSIGYTGLCYIPVYIMFRKRVFLKV